MSGSGTNPLRKIGTAACALGLAMGAPPADERRSRPAAPRAAREVDWAAARFVLTASDRCTAPTIRLVDGAAGSPGDLYRLDTTLGSARGIVYADLTGDGRDDTLLTLRCELPGATTMTVIAAMAVDAGGAVRPLGTVFVPEVWTWQPTDLAVWHGDIALRILDVDTGRCWTRYRRWSSPAGGFVRIDGD
ncbi:hypothetical protein FHR81_005042 [Actinoalloteichus hoggarensis]|uniref:Uncharacterized protein n=1 Tax=Actinoalloteichus hoggarensis TaxID=1470176 RepID=A0A221WB55_9PSEU|nr:hypothetical protein [Actinoalloteichus hoggarensis]ASO22893.1 hypothetical protein AHOG_26440 [Actinoalloteichus hoggarensis]MBB5923965.1 hypothetical protein [Actinoalloteichus hoggarensis]